tara:strand:+ start:201 stop:491 length:291 start_codon:yes stop_codon:yes gene_type:complete
LSVNKSDLIRLLSDNYPNFLQKDLKKFIDIFLNEMKSSLRRHERVELRDVFSMEPKFKKSRYARNPKTNEKIYTKEKYLINFKISKFWLKRINEEK